MSDISINHLYNCKSVYENFRDLSFRPQQVEALLQILDIDKRVICIQAPTGSGKTLIGTTIGEYYRRQDSTANNKVLYLVASKMLQTQIQRDFPEYKSMMGRNNFRCFRNLQFKCDLCTHTKRNPCPHKHDCLYETAKREVLLNSYHCLNYHYFLNEANYVGRFTNYPVIIADEADVLEDILVGFVEVTITQRMVDKFDLADPPRRTLTAKNAVDMWKSWFEDSMDEVKDYIDYLEAQIPEDEVELEDNSELVKKVLKELKYYQNVYNKIAHLYTSLDDTWVFDDQEVSWTFKPTWLNPEKVHHIFWQHGHKFILMSATFPPKLVFAKLLGLEPKDIGYIELPSTFPPERRQVYIKPIGDLGYSQIKTDLPGVVKEVIKIVNQHPDEKGIIHTVNYNIMKAIMRQNKRVGGRLISHNAKDKDQKLKEFINSKQPLVFVSPSSTRGLDLPDDLCRFSIIVKAPYLSLADKVVKKRAYSGRLGSIWYRSACVQEIVQASGRGMRHKEDKCVTYILDKQVLKILRQNRKLFPRYFLKAIELVRS